MKLADKPCYPLGIQFPEHIQGHIEGLTFRERLIIALASNEKYCWMRNPADEDFANESAKMIIIQADAIIKQLESEKK